MTALSTARPFATKTRHHAPTSYWIKAFLGVFATALLLCAGTVGAADYRLRTLADDLRWPWCVAQLPDGSFLITEREGRLLRLYPDGQRSIIDGTPPTLFAGQGGYFDVAVHPKFADNQLLYLSYAEGTPQANGTAVFRGRLQGDRLVNGQRILRVKPDKSTPQHYGGRMLFVPGGDLLITSGEGFEHREDAQDKESELGKVLRIRDTGEPRGVDARFFGEYLRVWTLGHRNPQGIALDHSSGLVYLHEHGPKGGDEVNVLRKGSNYGWPGVTHGVDYSGARISPFKQAPGYVDPLWTWVPSIAPSGLVVYNGNGFPEWRGSLLVGALVDREVRRLTLRDDEVVGEERLFGELNARIRDVRVLGGELYLLTDGEQGSLVHVRP